MNSAWVVNASPLIALGRIAMLSLLSDLGQTVMVPDQVIAEVEAGLAKDSKAAEIVKWASAFRTPWVGVPDHVAGWDLGSGEAQVIALCLRERGLAVLDDGEARRCAYSLGVSMIGTLGILLRAKRERLVPAVRPLAERLVQTGYYLNPGLVESVLARAGE